MTALILHPNDELFFSDLQKQITFALFTNERIIIQPSPLWVELGDLDLNEKTQIKAVQIKELSLSDDCVYCPVLIECSNRQIDSKLTLVCLHRGKKFTEKEIAPIKEKPVRQIKVFRLGLVQDEGLHAKSISKSVWCKIK